jgi:hypothetical protein
LWTDKLWLPGKRNKKSNDRKFFPVEYQLLVIAAYADTNATIVISDKTEIYWTATNLTIFDIGLACFRLIDQHIEILSAVRAFDVFLE